MLKFIGTLEQLKPVGFFETDDIGTYGEPTPARPIWTNSEIRTTGIEIDVKTREITACEGWCDEELELLVGMAYAGLVEVYE